MFRKNKVAMLVGEFLGTTVLTLAVLNMSNSQLNLPYFIATVAGLTLIVLIVSLANITGAVFNPALTIGLWSVRKLKTLQAISYIIVQLLGAAAAWYLFAYFTKIKGVEWNSEFDSRVLMAEVIGTLIFSFSFAAALYQRLQLGLKAVLIGGGLVVGSLIATLGSMGILNPAVAVSLHRVGWDSTYILGSPYVLGPIIGAIVGFNLYNLLFVKTEVAEVEELKEEIKEAEKVEAKVVKPARATATKKAPAKKTAAKKPVAKKTTATKKK